MNKYLFYIFFLFSMVSSNANAQDIWVNGDYARARIISDARMPSQAVIDIEMLDNWHTYWLAIGESGLAPTLDWSGSENIRDVNWRYPMPLRMDEMGLVIFGYKDKLSLFLDITQIDENFPAKLEIKLDLVVCEDICVPQSLSLSSDLTGNSQALIKHKQKSLPHIGNINSLRIDTIVASDQALVFAVYAAGGFDNMAVIAARGDYGFTASADITVDVKEPRKAMIKISATPDIKNMREFITGRELTILLNDTKNTIEYKHQF